MRHARAVGMIALLFSLAGGAAAQDSTANSNSGADARAGNVRNTVRTGPANNTQGITFEGSDRQAPPLMHAPQPAQTVVSTGIVSDNPLGHTASVTAHTLDDHYLNRQGPALLGHDLPVYLEESRSKYTLLTLSVHQNVYHLRKGDAPPNVYISVRPVITMIPLGTLLANVAPKIIKDGYGMPASAVTQDAANTLRTHSALKGLGNVIMATNTMMAGGGAGTRSMGDSKTAGLTLGFPGVNVGGSIGSVDGLSFPINVVSMLYLIGVPANPGDAGAVTYDLRTREQRDADEKKAAEARARAEAEAAAKAKAQAEANAAAQAKAQAEVEEKTGS